jgi:hypothetical protein
VPSGWAARSRERQSPQGRLLSLLVLPLSFACTDAAPPAPTTEANVDTPVPIDIRPGPGIPTHYKGLPLQLVQRPAPTVSPVDGVIGVVCIGMSNAAQECGRLLSAISAGGPWQHEVAIAVRFVNCAVGGHAIERWIDPAFDPVLWDACLGPRLAVRGVRPDQVRVIVHKAANQFGLGPGGAPLPLYPDPAANFHAVQRHLTAFAAQVRARFPAVQAVYTSSRSYGGFTPRPERGEPQAYEEGHALNQWLATNPTVDGVWYGWWGYLWAPDCASGGRNGQGICYERTDFQADAVHPTAAGEIKIARLLHDRLRAEAWYRR